MRAIFKTWHYTVGYFWAAATSFLGPATYASGRPSSASPRGSFSGSSHTWKAQIPEHRGAGLVDRSHGPNSV